MTLRPLPSSEVALLRDLRHDLPALRFRAYLLRRGGWSLSEIAQAVGAHRSSAQQWVSTFPRKARPGDPPVPAAPDYPSSRAARSASPSRPARPALTAAESSRLGELGPLARRNRAKCPPDSAFARASAELDTLALSAADRGVPHKDIASAAGVGTHSIQTRISRARVQAAR